MYLVISTLRNLYIFSALQIILYIEKSLDFLCTTYSLDIILYTSILLEILSTLESVISFTLLLLLSTLERGTSFTLLFCFLGWTSR